MEWHLFNFFNKLFLNYNLLAIDPVFYLLVVIRVRIDSAYNGSEFGRKIVLLNIHSI